MKDLAALHSLAHALGVRTAYTDGLGNRVEVGVDTLLRICSALGFPVERPADAQNALMAVHDQRSRTMVAPVLVAWDGQFHAPLIAHGELAEAALFLEHGGAVPVDVSSGSLRAVDQLPFGYHRLAVAAGDAMHYATVIAAPTAAFLRPDSVRRWGVAAQLAALRSRRSRSVGDLYDLESLCAWVAAQGGDVVNVLPLLPTFNTPPAEPSPYSPVTRLFWSELLLDLGDANQPTGVEVRLDVTRAHEEVLSALRHHAAPAAGHDAELVRYARFRGAQERFGRNWRDWPRELQQRDIESEYTDSDAVRFHLVSQTLVREQLAQLKQRLASMDVRLGLDLAVGVHPDGYDTWSRRELFADDMSVGAPPDAGFPSGQDWGFRPVLPVASQLEGHHYVAACIAHQMSLAGVLRVDHIMAWTRLYWIPRGFALDQGTYVSYPADELFAVLALESHRHQCEVVGENLGTVPDDIRDALPRHRIRGMYVAQFAAASEDDIVAPGSADVALAGSHDTPTFAGWLAADDVADRVRHSLVASTSEGLVRDERHRAAARLAAVLGADERRPREMLMALLRWLGRSASPMVIVWLEDLWLETRGVNLPGTQSSVQANWQRPMARLLDEIVVDADVAEAVRVLDEARRGV